MEWLVGKAGERLKTHETNESLYKEQQRSIEAGRGYIHDFKNHLNNIKRLYRDGNAKAAEYHDNLISQFEDIMAFQMIDVNNYVISNIFERVRQQCKLNDIEFVLDVQYDQLAFITPIDSRATGIAMLKLKAFSGACAIFTIISLLSVFTDSMFDYIYSTAHRTFYVYLCHVAPPVVFLYSVFKQQILCMTKF